MNLQKLLDERRAIQEEEKLFKQALAEVNDKILAIMEEQEIDKLTVGDESVTVVRQGPKIEYDWDQIHDHIAPEVWDEITVEVPNKDLLERAIAEGKVDFSTVKSAAITKPGSKPFVTVRKKK